MPLRFDAASTAMMRAAATPPRALAALAMALGAIVLVGWLAGIPTLTSIVPGYVTMKANTALGILTAGAALWTLAPLPGAGGRGHSRTAGLACAWICVAIGVATLIEYVAGITLIDELLVRAASEAELTATPGRMAVTTAATFVALGGGLLTLDAAAPAWSRLSQWCFASGIAVPLGVAVGYVYRVIPMHGVGQGIQMALHTAVACLAVGIGGIIARPNRDFARTMSSRGAGGVLARRLIPAALGVPILLGLLSLAAERWGSLSIPAGGAEVTTGTMFLLAWLIWRTASEIDQSEQTRLVADRERTEALEARAVAEAASAEKSRFLTVMSHELRTPLNAIVGFTELLDAGIYGPATLEQRAALARVRRSSDHLLSMVDQVLTVARVEAGAPDPLEIEEFQLDDVIGSIGGMLRGQPRADTIRLEIERIGATGQVRADRRRVGQVLSNLMVNAMKFSAPGGAVSVRPTVEGSIVVVRVCDAGCGVPADRREAIWAPFVQAKSGLTRDRDGVGLGLAISRSFARMMGGDVVLEHSDDRGSIFTFTFPRDAHGEIRRTPPSAMRVVGGSA